MTWECVLVASKLLLLLVELTVKVRFNLEQLSLGN